ncbi:MAG: ATP-binding cassette domain-containing protein [Leptospiraceae bacterium]|nr:ATP-binding cassette domain-containing protein [Leptospiraceae bacterium]MCP5511362.1 ATP-binding cassette domain-containing protein [Leptospiraceae bacterium]
MKDLFFTKDLTVGYTKNYPILKNININFSPGTISAIIGANGTGKTTFMKTLSGLLKPLSGKLIRNPDLRMTLVPQLKRINMGYPITVEKVLKMPEEANGFFPFYKFTKDQLEILEKLEILKYRDSLLRECSGGQIQKVLIARSLISNSNLILLDEPLDALDKKTRNMIFSMFINKINEQNASILIITHHLNHDWSDQFSRVLKTNEGRLEEVNHAESYHLD